MRQLSLFEPIEIPLTKGYVAFIDPIDADLAALKWSAHLSSSGNAYAAGWINKRNVLLHRVILQRIIGKNLQPYEIADHINGDISCNLRSNLRIANRNENCRNRRLNVNSSSRLKGVWWSEHCRRWRVRIKVNGREIHLGFFDDPLEAHAAYCAAALKYHGEFARFE